MDILKIGIARGIGRDELLPAFHAAIQGGFRHLEITMNTAGAEDLISLAAREFHGKAVIGAGTVTNTKLLKAALKSGARFIVSPVTDISMIQFCKQKKIPIYPGALTPTEILKAWEAGAEMVKVFPISSMGGASYIKELLGPFDGLKVLACGGVNPENLREYIRNGTAGIAIGSQLFKKEWLEKREFEKITESALRFNLNSPAVSQ